MGFGSFFRRCILGAAGCVLVMVSAAGCRIQYVEDETAETTVQQESVPEKKVEIRLWYSDEAFTDYFTGCADEYEKANRNVDITLRLMTETDYIDTVMSEAVKPDMVDIYMVDNDKLEQMKLAGIAAENRMTDIYNVYNFSSTALEACSYDGRLVAYPLSFDTTFLIYNTSYVQEAELSSFEKIKLFAENFEFEAGSSISSIFTCDLNEVFYNYGYLGAYLNIGGDCGDDRTAVFDITDELKSAAELYKQLVAYFYIDRESVDYYSCINGFESGSIVFTIGDMTMYHRAKACEGLTMGTAAFPDMSEEIKSAPLSVTRVLVVNPFSDDIAVAESFAKFLTYTNAANIYEQSKEPACRRIDTMDEDISHIYESYDKSVPKLKLMYSDEFYALLEIALHELADGAENEEALSAVRDYLLKNWQSDIRTEE